MRPALLDRRAQRAALAEQVLLADDLVERPRAHPRGQRALLGRDGGAPARRLAAGVEELVHAPSMAAQGNGARPRPRAPAPAAAAGRDVPRRESATAAGQTPCRLAHAPARRPAEDGADRRRAGAVEKRGRRRCPQALEAPAAEQDDEERRAKASAPRAAARPAAA